MKIIGIIVTLLVLILGSWIFSVLLLLHGTIYGYIGYCSQIKLPMALPFYVLEIILTSTLIFYFIVEEIYDLHETNSYNFPSLNTILILNVFAIASQIIQFPLVGRYGSLSATASQGIHINPLTVIGLVFCTFSILLNIRRYQKLKNIEVKLIAKSLYFDIALVIILTLAAVLGAEYIPCRG